MMMMASLSWALAPVIGFFMLSVAAASFVSSTLMLGVVFRSLTQPISKKLLVAIVVITFTFFIVIEVMRAQSTYFNRNALITTFILFTTCWQAHYLRHFMKHNPSIHLRLLLTILAFQAFLVLVRIYLNQHQIRFIGNIYEETGQLFYIRMIFTSTFFLLFIFTNNFFYESLWVKANQKTSLLEEQMLGSLNALSLARDNETGKHILRTQHYVRAIAMRLKDLGHYTDELSLKAIDLMYRAAPLHDIGKVGIPDKILCKPGQLTSAEWDVMKTHPLIGETILGTASMITAEDDVISLAIKIAGGIMKNGMGVGILGV